jgi:hypothetical protein
LFLDLQELLQKPLLKFKSIPIQSKELGAFSI